MALSDLLSELGGAISSRGQEAANKAKEMSGVSSLKSKITTAENGKKAVFAELGEKAFAEHADWIQAQYPELFEKVSGLQAEIEQYTQEIESLKQTTADANAALQKARADAAAESAARKAADAAKRAEAAQARAAAQQVEAAAETVADSAAETAAESIDVVSEATETVAEAVEKATEVGGHFSAQA